MFDAKQFLIPLEARRALSLSDSEWGLEEIQGLFTTLGGEVCDAIKFVKRRIDPRTYLGAGKLEEIATQMKAKDIDVLLLDFDVSPSQLKNIETIVKCLVLDRSGIILEIFSRHARTKEAKLQVEHARLQYLMPRLTHLWSHFERQRGSGGAALKGKGMGEKQIEVDRRLVKDRLNFLRSKIREVEQARDTQRKSREDLLKIALVGYTNAGKSTLLNALTHAHVLVEDALFATLDPAVRVLNPKSRPVVLAIDTVGFIDRLPHGLVASFRSTLSEVLEADLLIHVLDGSHAEVKRHFEVTMEVLKELEADKIPMILVFNKMDQCKDFQLLKVLGAALCRDYKLPPPLFLSALDSKGIDLLRDAILAFFEKNMETYEVVVPYEDGRTVAQICQVAKIESKKETPQGTFFRFKTMEGFAQKFNFLRYRV